MGNSSNKDYNNLGKRFKFNMEVRVYCFKIIFIEWYNFDYSWLVFIIIRGYSSSPPYVSLITTRIYITSFRTNL